MNKTSQKNAPHNLILKKNESSANVTVAKIMRITFYIFTLVYILALAGIFTLPKNVMHWTYLISAGILFLPSILNKVLPTTTKWLKNFYIILADLYIFLMITTVNYHAVLIFAYPIAIAGIYFSKRSTIFAIFLTCATTF